MYVCMYVCMYIAEFLPFARGPQEARILSALGSRGEQDAENAHKSTRRSR